jgi:hypothetical protein
VTKLSDDTERLKEIALRFCYSELTSHSSSIIGFAVILFAYLNVISQYFERIPFTLEIHNTPTSWRYLVVWLILSLIIAGIFFNGMRLVYYGKLTNEVIKYEAPFNSIKLLIEGTSKNVQNKRFALLKCDWFGSGASAESEGFWLSFPIGFLVAFIIVWTFLFY